MLSIPFISEPSRGDVPRRTSSRRRIDTLVYADFGPGNGGFPINLGEGGMAFQGIQPLERGQVISTRFKLPGSNDVLETTARVAWLNELGKGGGLQFTDLPEESRRVILHWCSLESQAGNETEQVSAGPQRIENKKSPSTTTSSPEASEGNSTIKTEAKSGVAPPSNVLASVRVTEAAPTRDSTAGSPPVADLAQTSVLAAGSRQSWIMPVTIAVFVCAAALIAIMAVLGVISVQFRWPLTPVNETSARSVAGPPAAQSPQNPYETMPNGPASDHPAPEQADSNLLLQAPAKIPAVKPVQPKTPASETSPARTATPAEAVTEKAPPQFVATARPMAPNPVKPIAAAEDVPPSVAPPAKPESTPEFSMISPQPLAPPAIDTPRKSGKFDPPQLVKRKDPVYPIVAKTTGISGSVELQFTITADGEVRDVSANSGNPILVRAAVEAVKAWRYQPARLGGVPVESQSTTIFNFKPN